MTENEPNLTHNSVVSLREITGETVRKICNLAVSDEQDNFVAPNAHSISEAYFQPKAWMRAIYADDVPVGFAMCFISPEKPMYYLWRFMIDQRYQKLGYGRRAMEQIMDFLRAEYPEAKEFFLTYVPGIEGNPQPFYEKVGFVDTGVDHDGEMEMKIEL
jgi:diamine N-acetyltransferase